MFKFHSSFMLVIACVACGSSFTANGGGLGGVGGESAASGGETNSAGSSSGGDAGESDVGGMGAAAGDASAGSGDTNAGSSGDTNAGSGGANAGSGGVVAGAGGATGADCAKLAGQYQALLEKARVCDKGSTDECNHSSTLEPLGCGCPVLVNAKSEYVASAKKARQAYLDAKCVDGVACSNVACVPTVGASCAQASGSGSGLVCTAATVVAN